MASQPGALRDALAEAGASPGAARKAAEAVAGHGSRISTVGSDPGPPERMLGTNIALTLAVPGKTSLN